MDDKERSWHEYYMRIALAVRERANCKGSRVGALIARDNRIISTGYNGTPEGMPNCLDGGCYRCNNRDQFQAGTGYDLCICVHAEQNALLSAARFGISTEGATVYTTTQPCFGCTKEMLQAKIRAVYYLHEWKPSDKARVEYERIQAMFSEGLHRLDMEDPRADWAISSRKRESLDETGHRES